MIALLVLAAGCKPETRIVLADAQNYAFASTIDADYQVIAAREDTAVNWEGLTTDLLGEPIDEITTVGLVNLADRTEEEVLRGINDDTLRQSDLTAFADHAVAPGETEAMVSTFSLFGTYVVPSENLLEGNGAYMATAQTGDAYRMFCFFRPVEGAEPAPVLITPSCATLSFTVDLAAGAPIGVPREGRVIVDWSELTTSSSGLPIDLGDVDTLMLAHFEETTVDLEADFLHVDSRAEMRWSADVEGWGDWYLDDLADGNGAAFVDFTNVPDEGTWLLALRCSSCLNPAPPFMGVLRIE